MNVIITGGGGFIGARLAMALGERPYLRLAPEATERTITRLTLVDVKISDEVRASLGPWGDAVNYREGDVTAPGFLADCFPRDGTEPVAVFHLASIVSAGAEADFDLAMKVNLDAMREVLEICRRRDGVARLVFASSVATFGGHAMTPTVSDRTKQIPQSTYGMTKVISELLINDYARKGFVDGRTARLPTVFVRPGQPNLAASSFASGVIREPLHGQTCELPVARSLRMPLLSYPKIVENLVLLVEVEAAKLGDDRAVNLPSGSYSVQQLIEALERVAAKRGIKLGAIEDVPKAAIQTLVGGWPQAMEWDRAAALGMRGDDSLEAVIERFIDDYL